VRARRTPRGAAAHPGAAPGRAAHRARRAAQDLWDTEAAWARRSPVATEALAAYHDFPVAWPEPSDTESEPLSPPGEAAPVRGAPASIPLLDAWGQPRRLLGERSPPGLLPLLRHPEAPYGKEHAGAGRHWRIQGQAAAAAAAAPGIQGCPRETLAQGCAAAAHQAVAGVVCVSGPARPGRALCALDAQCTAATLPRHGAWCAVGQAVGQRRSWCLALLHAHPSRLTRARCGKAQAYAALQAMAAGVLGGAANGVPGGAADGAPGGAAAGGPAGGGGGAGPSQDALQASLQGGGAWGGGAAGAGPAAAAAPGAGAGAGEGAAGTPTEPSAHHVAAARFGIATTGMSDEAVRVTVAAMAYGEEQQPGLSESGESLPWPQSDLSDMEADAEGEALLEAEAGHEAGDGSEGEGGGEDEAGDVLDMEADLDGLDGHMGTNLTEGRNACANPNL